MQYLILATDHTDPEAYLRRLQSREGHIKLLDKLKAEAKMLFGTAIFDEAREKMIGSAIVCDFSSREELEEYLKQEPYVINRVWEKIEIKACQVGPTFAQIRL